MFIKSKCKPFLNYEVSESFMGKLLNTFPFKDFSPSHRKKKQIEKTVFYFINVLYVHKGPVKPLQHTQLAAKMIA